VAVEKYTNNTRAKSNLGPREVTPLEKYLMAVVVLVALVPMVTLFFLPLTQKTPPEQLRAIAAACKLPELFTESVVPERPITKFPTAIRLLRDLK
jgi:hypothetical protein